MRQKLKKFLSKSSPIYIILLGCILGSLLILNSNHVNEQKTQMNLDKEQDALFKRIISKRKLQQTSPNTKVEKSKTEEVCERASDELLEYYATSDLSKIDLDNGAIKCENKNEDYMKALIDLVRNLVGGDDDDDENNPSTPANEPNLRNLLEEEDKENIKTYSSRVLPMIIFLAIGVLSIIGYIVCWISCCCDCCWCCCCKKVKCEIPCFIFTYIFYALVVAVSLYGLTQTKKIFTGLANTECSFLEFFDQVLKGEKKEITPKWIGITKIDKLLRDLKKNLNQMKNDNLLEQLDSLLEDIDDQRDKFMPKLKRLHKNFYEADGETPLDKYCINYPTVSPLYYYKKGTETKYLRDKYVLDIIPALGKYDEENQEFKPGLIYYWNYEISEIDKEAEKSLSEARGSFQSMLTGKLEDILEALETGIEQLGEIKKPFDNAYNDISDILYDASEIMDKDGKLAVNLVFGVLVAMNICLAVLLLLICLFSGKSCVDCDFFRCLFKFATHILWNILAIFMILAFLVGSILALIGRIGEDMMSLVSYVVSEENFNNEVNPVVLNELGKGKDALKECILGDGDLSDVFGLNDVSTDFDTIKTKKTEIKDYINQFKDLAFRYPAYNAIIQNLKSKTEFISDSGLVHSGSISDTDTIINVNISQIITALNEEIGETQEEKWDQHEGDKSFVCTGTETGNPEGNKLHPWACEPNDRDWISSSSEAVKNYAKIATDIVKLLKKANETSDDGDDYYNIMYKTKIAYKKYLETYLEVLEFFDDVIGDVVNALEEAIGSSSDTFSFLNGKFIQINVKILLKYLKYSLGKDIYTVGLCLIIVGCSLIFSVSSTILLIIIINIVLEDNKKLQPATEVPAYPEANEGGRIMKFEYN